MYFSVSRRRFACLTIAVNGLAKGSFHITIVIVLQFCPIVVWSEDSWLREHAGQLEEGMQNGTETMEANEVRIPFCLSGAFYVSCLSQNMGAVANFH